MEMETLGAVRPTSEERRDFDTWHRCIVNVGLFRSGTTTLSKAASKLGYMICDVFPDLSSDQHKKILHNPVDAVQEWASTGGIEEVVDLVTNHDLICDGWVALLPFLSLSDMREIEKRANESKVDVKFVATSRNIEGTVKSELQHWVIHNLEHRAELSREERERLEADLRARAVQHQQRIKLHGGLINLLPLGCNIQNTWKDLLASVSTKSATSWGRALKDVGVYNANPALPTEGILLTMRLGENSADKTIKNLLNRIEEDKLCKYILMLGIDEDELNTDAASLLIQQLQTHSDQGQQMKSLHIVANPPQSSEQPFAICQVWDVMATEAWKHGADWVMLLGDDVEIDCSYHYRAFYRCFLDISLRLGVPFGFGCPFWNDRSFPGFPSFPCIGKSHVGVFGALIPDHRKECFINQDLDPYIHALYDRLGAAPCVHEAILHNGVGGSVSSGDARYERVPAKGWRDFVLDDYRDCIRPYIPKGTHEDILMDVVVPSFRVRLDYLQSICYLKVPKWMKTNFIIIIDNKDALLRAVRDISNIKSSISVPEAESVLEHHLAKSGNNVRVRSNDRNLGASASRNRGLDESAAEFVLNLDDDLIPDDDLLEQYGKKLKDIDESVVGLVGLVRFPRTPDMPLRHAAVLMSYLTFMFEIAERSDTMYNPAWGVTANILFRRTPVRFDLAYAKTGGGEDVDYALRVTEACGGGSLLAIPEARVVHPFWPGSTFVLSSHFYNWAIGDGALFKKFPEYCYWSFPNLPETLVASLPVCLWAQIGPLHYLVFILRSIAADFIVDFIFGNYRHRISIVQGIGKDKVATRRSHFFYFFAHILANLYIIGLECGRLRGHVGRLDVSHGVCRRFDWHIGRLENAPKNFRSMEAKKFALFIAILTHIMSEVGH